MPPNPLSAVLLAHEAPDFCSIQDAWLGQPKSQGTLCHKFVVLGRFDQLIVTQSDDARSLFPEQAKIITNARAATSSSYIGRLVSPADFDSCTWAATHPIVGLCSVRFARRILAAAGNFDFLDEFLTERLQQTNVRHGVVSATGWEDALVFFFARDFNSISQGAGLLRSMRLTDLSIKDKVSAKDGFTHPCLTTSTLPAFCCQWNRAWTNADTEALLARVDENAPLHWAVRIELHPGHWNGFAKHLEKLSADLGISITCRPTFGQTDLRVSDNGETAATHAGLLRFLLHVIFPLGAEPDTVMRSAETHLHPVLDEYIEDENAGPCVDQKVRQPNDHETTFPNDIREKLSRVAIPPHTLRVLEETLGRVQGMSHDPLHGEEFQTLQRLRNAFMRAVRRLPADMKESESRQFQRDVSEWQGLLDRCLADRFRGPYPVGDSLMMRLSTYQGAHHRFLVIADTLAQQAYDLARGAIKEQHADCVLPEAAIATFIGNSPSAYATAHTIDQLGCGFTDVPATLVCRLRDAHLLLHETGHHVVRAFFASLPNLCFNPYIHDPVAGIGERAQALLLRSGITSADIAALNNYWKKPGVLREIRELLADYFASRVCFQNRINAHKDASLRTLAGFFDGGSESYLRSVQTEFRLRSGGIEALQINKAEALTLFGDVVKRGMRKIREQGGNAIDFERTQKRADVIGYAVHAVQILSNVPEIKALLDAFDYCGSVQCFHGEDPAHSLLVDLRSFLSQSEPVSLDANFEFLDSLWFKLLRRQERQRLLPDSP